MAADAILWEWANFGLRWLHVIAGMAILTWLAVRVAQNAGALLAAPARAHTVCTTPFSPATRTRNRSVDVAAVSCAKYMPNDRVSARPAGEGAISRRPAPR